MGILVGTKTALVDDPHLTVRHVEGVNPLRIVIDTNLTLPSSRALFNNEVETWVFNASLSKRENLTEWKRIDPARSIPEQIVEELFTAKKLSVIIEGGSHTLQQFIDAGLWDEARVFQSKKRFETGIALGGLFIANFGIGIATTIIGVAIGSPTIAERGLVISLCPPWILPIAEVARTLVNFLIVEKLRGPAYLRGPLASKTPDSLGGVIDAIREAGLRVKVKALGHDCSDIQFGRIDDEEWPVSFEFSTMPDRRFARSQGRGSRD